MTLIVPTAVRGQDLSVRIKRPGERRSLSRSATRALDVMELFGHLRRPLRAMEVAKALGTHSSTTNQLLKTMVDSAHLIFDAREKTYLPSPRLAAFGVWLGETYGSEKQVRAILDEVHARTGLVVTISTANDLDLQVIDLAAGPDHGGERGLRVSIFGSAIGSAYLAMMDDAEVVRLAERARIPEIQLLDLLHSAARIRHEGYAEGPITGGAFWSVAVPLPMRAMGAAAVLGLAGSPGEVQNRVGDLVAIMHEAIGRLNPAQQALSPAEQALVPAEQAERAST
ncbi:MAG: helix-turn-helix domain-containing protein [Novosphingobium sp.]